MQTDISVILTIYNQADESIRTTMRSIGRQTGCSFQLIVADDHSDASSEEQVAAWASEYHIANCCYVRHPSNVQTVRNILYALPNATGKYVKAIGAGDALFHDNTLADIVSFCEATGARAGFGDIVIDLPNKPSYQAPKTASLYPPEGTISHSGLIRVQLKQADWIPGCCQFFERERLKELLEILSERYEVRYCEDFAQTLALLDEPVFHLPEPILLYEWGTGISTGGSSESTQRLYADHERLYRTLSSDYPNDRQYRAAYRRFRLRKFLALKTPLYPILQRLVANSYMRHTNKS